MCYAVDGGLTDNILASKQSRKRSRQMNILDHSTASEILKTSKANYDLYKFEQNLFRMETKRESNEWLSLSKIKSKTTLQAGLMKKFCCPHRILQVSRT